MGQHYQEESEGRQAEEVGDLVTIVSCNVPNNIQWTTELKKLTGVKESFVSEIFYPVKLNLLI